MSEERKRKEVPLTVDEAIKRSPEELVDVLFSDEIDDHTFWILAKMYLEEMPEPHRTLFIKALEERLKKIAGRSEV